MKSVSIIDIIEKKIFKKKLVEINGWVRTKRNSKLGISFVDVYDGSCLQHIQVIAKKDLSNYKSDILRLTSGCSVKIFGVLKKSLKNSKIYELHATCIKVLGWIKDPGKYPISSKPHTLEYLRSFSHLRPRTNIIGSVSRIRNIIFQEVHNFLNKKGFIWVPSPIITSLNTEGSGEMFKVSTFDFKKIPLNKNKLINYRKDFFGKRTFLTVSGQLHIESYACSLSKVYTFGPTFRAENSNTSRHLAEFWMVEIEIAFAKLNDIILLAYNLLSNIFKKVLNKCLNDLIFLEKKLNINIIKKLKNFIEKKLIEVEYCEAIRILKNCEKNFRIQLKWGMDLSSEHERYLSDLYYKSHIVIKNYPKEIKAFYMRLNKDKKTVAAADILLPGIGEIIGGSEREDRLEYLDSMIKEKRLIHKNYEWYRDLRKYGTVPHSGFGLGIERLISYVTGLKNIRDVIPFPRSSKNASF
ncbi:asnS [Wigglesworthia glossinidia endosymbiont of Glossina brevipalpis]|uniref:Asparagine--tRNA ligase n=1 Tax=Wigglesworthia glossinidia brevipalpis TaxID=36870 RepID=SYN_WIGBR|nr:RecName: Full=Asparagine--tRNA ligase; AltName: Full=Asparaginyl-tRNA synthetase; Short=AsnRS [Wigglesworthia glossinidia endosymbiont of Glossina brevipalpis]BAC24409.1 asnS [Wigglesworthia glossinidia endosymbiont of Glossina brevipalpis]